MRKINLYTVLNGLFVLLSLIYLILFGVHSLTRLRQFSPDSMNYVDVARNIIGRRGITQSTLGFNQPHWDARRTIPTPLTSQPPLYPLLIALLGLLGASLPNAALLVPLFFYGLSLLLAYGLARELYGHGPAILAVGCLLIYAPLRYVASFAWSESVALTWVLLAFWLLARPPRSPRQQIALPLGAGLAMGLAFATRYAFLPAFVLGVLSLIDLRDQRRMLRNLALYTAGFGLLAVWVIGRSLIFDGTLLGPARNPSLRNISYNLYDTIVATFEMYLDVARVTPPTQYLAFRLSLLVLGLIGLLRRKLRATLEGVFLSGKTFLLTFWALGYLAFLLYQRTTTHFDNIGPRLIVPGGAVLVILGAVWLAQTLRLAWPGRSDAPDAMHRYLVYPALLLAGLSIAWEIQTLRAQPPTSEAQAIARSERLSWVAAQTTDRDLIIGDDTMDIPFYFNRSAAVSFSPYPYTDYFEYDQLMDLVQSHCGEYDRFFMVLRQRYHARREWQWAYGTFIANLAEGLTQDYPGIIYRRQLSDGHILEIQCAK